MKNLTINVGDYVRTKYGIAKIIDLKENPYGEKTIYVLDNKIISMCECEEGILYSTINPLAEDLIDKFDINFGDESQIIKSSSNIIDLIEEGDYVNGEKVIALKGDPYAKTVEDENDVLYTDFDREYGEWLGYKEIEIKSIVTKEQMEAMEYKIER